MCGICGIYNQNASRNETEYLLSMRASLSHRGPDSVGIYTHAHGGLATCRLSIVDIEGSDQPLFNEDNSLVLVYNGMIYNFKELRNELQGKGHRFKTSGDGEVIIHLFEERGVEAFNCLHGMFALALYDCRENALILARDHFGIKPLYYYYDNRTFIFSSEIKPMIRTGLVKDEIDGESLNFYFSYNYIPGKRTLYRNVYEFIPGHFLKIKKSSTYQLQSFWKLKNTPPQSQRELPFESIKSNVNNLIEQSVEKHLYSDVEVGCFLSGGIDSSSLVHFISQHTSRPLKTFSIGYDNKSYDERTFARLVSQAYGTEHIELVCTERDVMQFLETLPQISDIPLGDQAIVSTYLVSRLARKHVKVCFSGEGADELFIGYQTYTANCLYKYFHYCPNVFLDWMEKFMGIFPASDKKVGFDYQMLRFIQGLKFKNLIHAHPYWRVIFTEEEKRNLFKPSLSRTMRMDNMHEVYYERIEGEATAPEYFSNADFTGFLLFNNLQRTDMYSMRNALEVRVPFLYVPLVEYVTKLPFSIRFKYARPKHLLKEIMKGRLDGRILQRKKGGWHMPIALWLKGHLFNYCHDIFNSQHPLFDSIIDRKKCINLLIQHKAGRENNAYKIWGLLVLLKQTLCE